MGLRREKCFESLKTCTLFRAGIFQPAFNHLNLICEKSQTKGSVAGPVLVPAQVSVGWIHPGFQEPDMLSWAETCALQPTC